MIIDAPAFFGWGALAALRYFKLSLRAANWPERSERVTALR
jgi:hypothetical protein